jgi:hypothetical protein
MGQNAEVAQLVERNLAKVEVAGSSLVFRSKNSIPNCIWVEFFICTFTCSNAATWVAELVDALDLKSSFPQRKYGFNSRPGYTSNKGCNFCSLYLF